MHEVFKFSGHDDVLKFSKPDDFDEFSLLMDSGEGTKKQHNNHGQTIDISSVVIFL